MRRIHHEDFTFHDQQAVSGRFALDDEREALAAQHARRRAQAQDSGTQRTLFAWLRQGIAALLSIRHLS